MASFDQKAIDISAGFHTLVAISGKEIVRQSAPYSSCTHTNLESQLLREEVSQMLGYQPSKVKGDKASIYTQYECRVSCLQRKIWRKCQCLSLDLTLPYKNIAGHLLCGTLGDRDMDVFLKADDSEKGSCFEEIEKLVSENCTFLHKMITDLACVREEKQKFTEKKLSGQSDCNCEDACYSYEYEVTISQSRWPSPGFETHAAYDKLIAAFNWTGLLGSFHDSPVASNGATDSTADSGSGQAGSGSGNPNGSEMPGGGDNGGSGNDVGSTGSVGSRTEIQR